MIRTLALTVLWGLTASTGAVLAAPDPTALGVSIDKATPKKANERDPALVAKAEILLDRAHISPGEIDGLDGDNFHNAVRAFQQVNSLPVSGDLDAATWGALKRDGVPVLKAYTITVADAAGPFTRAIPSNSRGDGSASRSLLHQRAVGTRREVPHEPDFVAGAQSARGFRAGGNGTHRRQRARDAVAVRPAFRRSGSPPNPPKASNDLPEVTIVVDKPARNVRVYDRDGKFLAFYPATIGSEEKPAPSGDFKVKGVSWNPKYEYDPKFAWKGVSTKRKLSIGPGPNNPVGLVWIDLTDPTYGIHGTPAPSVIGKTQSHGCIRLTNCIGAPTWRNEILAAAEEFLYERKCRTA